MAHIESLRQHNPKVKSRYNQAVSYEMYTQHKKYGAFYVLVPIQSIIVTFI